MKAGTIGAVLIVAAYVGLEAFAASKARPRMEPDYIYRRLVAAQVAADRCGGVPEAQRVGFDATLDRVRLRLRRKLTDLEPAPDSLAIDAEVDELRRASEAEAVALLDAEGCDSSDGRALMRRHEIYSTK